MSIKKIFIIPLFALSLSTLSDVKSIIQTAKNYVTGPLTQTLFTTHETWTLENATGPITIKICGKSIIHHVDCYTIIFQNDGYDNDIFYLTVDNLFAHKHFVGSGITIKKTATIKGSCHLNKSKAHFISLENPEGTSVFKDCNIDELAVTVTKADAPQPKLVLSGTTTIKKVTFRFKEGNTDKGTLYLIDDAQIEMVINGFIVNNMNDNVESFI